MAPFCGRYAALRDTEIPASAFPPSGENAGVEHGNSASASGAASAQHEVHETPLQMYAVC
jgi:hypothetical protein